jgi:hypothetical protein
MNKICKKIESNTEYYVKFTDEELKELNIKEGDKFSWDIKEDGILLTKYEKIDLDLSEFSRELLEFIICESNNRDLTISEFIEQILTEKVKNNI